MTQQRHRLLIAYQWLAGLCDLSTGLLLLILPAGTLRLMGIEHPPQPIEFARFIGAFVAAVGVSYLYAALLPTSHYTAARWQTVWFLTALSRSLVALFLVWSLTFGAMEHGWWTVAATDGLLAGIQWIGLRRGWLTFEA